MRTSSIHFLSLLKTKVIFNLQAEARKSQLSYAWWILEPLLEAAVFYVIFGIFLAREQENFVPFLLTGLIPWTWFSRSVGNSMTSLTGAQGFMVNFKIAPIFFPLVQLGQDMVKQIATFSFLLAFLLLTGIKPTLLWLGLPFVMLLQIALVFSVGCFCAAIVPLMRDLTYLISTMLLAIMFASGIFYNPETLVTSEWQLYFYANPVASLIQIYRDILMWNRIPDLFLFGYVLGWSIILALIARFALNKYRHSYARIIQE